MSSPIDGSTASRVRNGTNAIIERIFWPSSDDCQLVILDEHGNSTGQVLNLNSNYSINSNGSWSGSFIDVELPVGTYYALKLPNMNIPNASASGRTQELPDHPHGICYVAAPGGKPEATLDQNVYEATGNVLQMHIGTFTNEGTYDGLTSGILDGIRRLGFDEIQLLPLAMTSGKHNWGYDGVASTLKPSYGSREGLRKMIDRCHIAGLSVTLDGQYNHLGSDGNYLWPQTEKDLSEHGEPGDHVIARSVQTPWGNAMACDEQAWFEFIKNDLQQMASLGFDAVRLDATHAYANRAFINKDGTLELLRCEKPLVESIVSACEEIGRARNSAFGIRIESDQYSTAMMSGGSELLVDCLLHATSISMKPFDAGADNVYLEPYKENPVAIISEIVNHGFPSNELTNGQTRALNHIERGFWAYPPMGLPNDEQRRHLVWAFTHDQIGNSPDGDARISPRERILFLAAASLLPGKMLLFQAVPGGKFAFFVDHKDPGIREATINGRANEFANIAGASEKYVSPVDVRAFERSRTPFCDAVKQYPDVFKHVIFANLIHASLSACQEMPDATITDNVLKISRGGFVLYFNSGINNATINDSRPTVSSETGTKYCSSEQGLTIRPKEVVYSGDKVRSLWAEAERLFEEVGLELANQIGGRRSDALAL